MNRTRVLFLCCMLAGAGGPAKGAGIEQSRVEYVMGTMLEVRVTAADRITADSALDTAFAIVHRLDSLLSNYRVDSEISRIAASAPNPVHVSGDTFEFVQRSLEFARLTDGAFDPTVGSVVELWGFYSGDFHVPSSVELAGARLPVGYDRVRMDERAHTIAVDSGTILDPGGAGKGFALDRAIARLGAMGLTDIYFDFGGQICRWGSDTVGIAVRHPRTDSIVVSQVYFASGSVATSGDYERYFDVDGVRYAHIVDPRSGMPVPSQYAVSVYASDPWTADALSTALYVLGPDAGAELMKQFSGAGAMYVMVDSTQWMIATDSTWQTLEGR